jgi:hypothetical protein
MATLDIREQQEEEITEIRYDDSEDRLIKNMLNLAGISIVGTVVGYPERFIVEFSEVDNFIAAIKKAKELWAE